MPLPHADRIAALALSAFASLPQKSKPRLPAAGRAEWVTVAAIVVEDDSTLTCASLGTGVKCLPASKIPLARGFVLHDCHAEILAIRAFNAFLLQECKRSLAALPHTNGSRYIRPRNPTELTLHAPQPFTIRESIKIHMFTSEAPCGDSSMSNTISAQLDPTPWTPPSTSTTTTPSPSTPSTPSQPSPPILLRGRTYFSHLGHLRTKPGRPDSPPTHSKSCSDKLATKQLVSLLLTPTSYLITPSASAYISTLIIPAAEYDAVGCERAFASRLGDMKGFDGRGGYAWRPFKVLPAEGERVAGFEFSRRNVTALEPEMVIPSNISAAMVLDPESPDSGANTYTTETLIGGVLQGRKAFSSGALGASQLSKHRLWRAAREVAGGWLDGAKDSGVDSDSVGKQAMEWMVAQTGSYEMLKVPSSLSASGDKEEPAEEEEEKRECRVVEKMKRARWAAKTRVRRVLANAGDGYLGGDEDGGQIPVDHEWIRNGGNYFGL